MRVRRAGRWQEADGDPRAPEICGRGGPWRRERCRICLGTVFELSLGKYGLEQFRRQVVWVAGLQGVVPPGGLPGRRLLGPDPMLQVLRLVPGADEGHLVKHRSSEAVCLFSLYLKKFQEMWPKSSGLPLSAGSLPAARGAPGSERTSCIWSGRDSPLASHAARGRGGAR